MGVRPLLVVIALLLVGAPASAQQPAFPVLSGRVVDQANILSLETEQWVTSSSANLEQATTNQLVLVTLASLQGLPIEDFGYQLGRHWGIGRAGKSNGVLMIVAPIERAVRIEVGYGLEGLLTDAISRGIIEQRIIPRFRDNDFDGGVRAGVEAVAAVLSGDTAAAARLQERGSRRIAPPASSDIGPLALIVLFVLLFILPRFLGRRGRRGIFYGGLGGFGGMRGGRGFGGGGFRGGGGSFGGGGASGRW